MRYLKKFKWHHLTEKMAYERQIREQRLKVQVAQARRENSQYLEDVDQARRIEHKVGSQAASASGAKDESASVNLTSPGTVWIAA